MTTGKTLVAIDDSLLAAARKTMAKATPRPWRVGTFETWHVYAPHPEGLAGPGGERVLLRMNEHHPYASDAAAIVSAIALADAVLAADGFDWQTEAEHRRLALVRAERSLSAIRRELGLHDVDDGTEGARAVEAIRSMRAASPVSATEPTARAEQPFDGLTEAQLRDKLARQTAHIRNVEGVCGARTIELHEAEQTIRRLRSELNSMRANGAQHVAAPSEAADYDAMHRAISHALDVLGAADRYDAPGELADALHEILLAEDVTHALERAPSPVLAAPTATRAAAPDGEAAVNALIDGATLDRDSLLAALDFCVEHATEQDEANARRIFAQSAAMIRDAAPRAPEPDAGDEAMVDALVARTADGTGPCDCSDIDAARAAVLSRLATLRAELAEKTAEHAALERSANLRWNADQRAIKRWQAEAPGRELTWPDHADLCCWLLCQLSERTREAEEARDVVAKAHAMIGRGSHGAAGDAACLLSTLADVLEASRSNSADAGRFEDERDTAINERDEARAACERLSVRDEETRAALVASGIVADDSYPEIVTNAEFVRRLVAAHDAAREALARIRVALDVAPGADPDLAVLVRGLADNVRGLHEANATLRTAICGRDASFDEAIAKATTLHADVSTLKEYALRAAHALGTCYEADYAHEPGPIESVEEEARTLRADHDALVEIEMAIGESADDPDERESTLEAVRRLLAERATFRAERDEALDGRERVTAGELLRLGGEWLGAARSWIQRKARNGEHVTWGSDDTLEATFSVRDIEELAADAAAIAMRPQPVEQHVSATLRARWTAEHDRDSARTALARATALGEAMAGAAKALCDRIVAGQEDALARRIAEGDNGSTMSHVVRTLGAIRAWSARDADGESK